MSEGSEQLRLLSQVGITELLDQDDRPTFIVDLGDTSNYNTSMLHILYANTALRSYGLLDVVSGRVEEQSLNPMVPNSFPQFKAWILGAAVDGESLDVCLPSFVQGSVSWSCSTLRKRLRIASGTIVASTIPIPDSIGSHSMLVSNSEAHLPLSDEYLILRKGSGASVLPSVPSIQEEAQDYFGAAVNPATGFVSTPSGLGAEVVPSVESALIERSDAAITPGKTPSVFFDMGEPEEAHSPSSNFSSNDTSDSAQDSSSDHSSPIHDDSTPSPFTVGAVNAPSHPLQESEKEMGFFDWTRLPVSDKLPPHIQFARSVDWDSTALGPIENWSSDLRQMCNLIMASPHPAAMYWGADLVAIYNEAYVLLAGQKHPNLMGQRYREAWAEIWDDVKEVFANATVTGQATMKVR